MQGQHYLRQSRATIESQKYRGNDRSMCIWYLPYILHRQGSGIGSFAEELHNSTGKYQLWILSQRADWMISIFLVIDLKSLCESTLSSILILYTLLSLCVLTIIGHLAPTIIFFCCIINCYQLCSYFRFHVAIQMSNKFCRIGWKNTQSRSSQQFCVLKCVFW